MVQHIDISVLLAEIEREYKSLSNATDDFAMGKKAELKNILSFLGALEVKEEVTTTDAFIKKACNYLFSHMGLFVTFFDDDIVEDIERSEFIKKFRIAMEDNYETSGHK